jgi:hypothetical protein
MSAFREADGISPGIFMEMPKDPTRFYFAVKTSGGKLTGGFRY